ncbi:hypothetical protein MSS2_04711 [Mycobacterium marinum]|uniref:DUF6602 domain-containing protein n=1 Tax=Mycobacterium marinum TaxID=1781 RepID=UPI000E3D4F65|nr:DUF6602 domain-containing protein [Mycobacterium marinum]RFZ48544.1 hypothetical protein MSS2_04711 [Mycobacterium marinum]
MTADDNLPADASHNRFDLAEAFRARQQQLESDLGFGRTVLAHPGTLGDATELDWRGMLADFLPRRYGIAKAFVIDIRGAMSHQLDIVIHDRHYSPLLFEVGGAHFIPAESVYAVFEIKQSLSKKHIKYAGDKIASVRHLHRTSVEFITATGAAPAQEPKRILGGLLALDSEWTPALGKPLRNALTARTAEQAVDFGCALRAGTFEAPDPTARGTIWTSSDPTTSLIFFALRLLKRLRAMATVPAMDFAAYIESARSQSDG